MNLLLIAEIAEGLRLPPFGTEFEKHMEAKRNPTVYAASSTAWRLLELALQRAGVSEIPQVRFEEKGKPVFADSPLHFSLSHSGRLAAALLSDSPCAVDVEAVKSTVRDDLILRCLNGRELELGCDFFECWTRKECLGKLSGEGLPSRPNQMDSLNPIYTDHFHLQRFTDAAGQEYALSALCMNCSELHIQKIEPEELY